MMGDGEYDPSTIGALEKLGQLRCLNLSGCLQNYYDQGNEIGAKNIEVGGVHHKMSFFQMARKSFLSDQTYST